MKEISQHQDVMMVPFSDRQQTFRQATYQGKLWALRGDENDEDGKPISGQEKPAEDRLEMVKGQKFQMAPDKYERLLYQAEVGLNKLVTAAKKIYDPEQQDDERETGGGVALLNPSGIEPAKISDNPMIASYLKFIQSAHAALNAANEIWWESAVRTSHRLDIDKNMYNQQKDTFSASLDRAMAAYEQLQAVAGTTPEAYEFRKLDTYAFGDGEGIKGFFPRLEKLQTMLSRQHLFVDTVKKGLEKPVFSLN